MSFSSGLESKISYCEVDLPYIIYPRHQLRFVAIIFAAWPYILSIGIEIVFSDHRQLVVLVPREGAYLSIDYLTYFT